MIMVAEHGKSFDIHIISTYILQDREMCPRPIYYIVNMSIYVEVHM